MSKTTLLSIVASVLLVGMAAAADPSAPAADKKGLELTAGDYTIKFYGFARLDVHYDDSHPNNTRFMSAVKAEDDSAPAGIREDSGSENLLFHARNSRLGLDVKGPAIENLWNAQPSAKLEMDFAANGGSEATAVSRAVMRMRVAYVKLAWDDKSILAGQAWDVAGPLNPTAYLDFVLWGAGNVGDRRPMLMGECRHDVANGVLTLQTEIGLTGADDGDNIDASTIPDGESSGLPTLQGRAAYKHDVPWLEKKSAEIGLWGHFAKEHLDTLPAGWTAAMDDDFTSTMVGVDFTVPVANLLTLRGEGWQGKNLNDVRGGILQGVQVNRAGDEGEVESRGYWAELLFKAHERYTVGVGASADNPVDSDLTGTPALATTGAASNNVTYLVNRVDVGGGLTCGADIMHWVTQWRGGDFEGTDNRVNFFVQYSF